MRKQYLIRLLGPLAVCFLAALTAAAQERQTPREMPSIVHKVNNASERMEMTVNTSRILTMERKIAQTQVNNPELIDVTPLSPTQIQISAKATGVTQINLWSEDDKVFTIDVIVFGDVRELQLVLQTSFPNAALKVMPVANAVMVSGFVDKPEHVERVISIAEQYYPKVINNMAVGGVQKVLLHVKVMEVSRTKLRQLGFDWAKITGSNVITSGPSGLITDYDPTDIAAIGGLGGVPGKLAVRSASPSTFAFNVVNGKSGFFGVLDALRQDNLMKIMSEPTLVAINGQHASFNSGGEIPVPEPQSLGTISIAWKKYGTQIKFVPIVLGNGNLRLEVHSEISELDETRSFSISGTQVPGIKMRDVHTAVEMMAGQTLAIAGLVQTRVEASNAGLPWISEVPYLGAAFRNVKENRNEVELLIMVTPELVEPMDAEEVSECGPGLMTESPNDWELFMHGHLEVPKRCPTHGDDCQGECQSGGLRESPPEGMILGPNEEIPAPLPADAAGRPVRRAPHNRYVRSNQNASPRAVPAATTNGPPGIIGPVGYDVVK
ncbi:MAG: histidine kinase [Pirellulaceae bacterium]|nr:histidine kinase [Pirellulaceae bacterium]